MATLFTLSLSRLTTLSPQFSPSALCLHSNYRSTFSLPHKRLPFLRFSSKALNEEVSAAIGVDDKLTEKVWDPSKVDAVSSSENSVGQNGSAEAPDGAVAMKIAARFEDSRWVSGTWDLDRFQRDGKINWDAVIDAEVYRRKWLEKNPEASSNGEPVVFDTAIIPWWAWTKRFHLPEAEKLNGRAAMIGFFMAYMVDSITGLGIVDQADNWVCKTLLFVAISGVLLIRRNDDFGTLKKLVEETTLYDKQWQASWKDDGFKD